MRRATLILLAVPALSSCNTAGQRAPVQIAGPELNPVTEWQAGRQPVPGQFVKVTDGPDGTGTVELKSAALSKLLTLEPAPALSTDITVTTKAEVSLAVKFIAKFLPSANVAFKDSLSVNRKVENASGLVTPSDTTAVFSQMDSLQQQSGKSPSLADNLAAIRSQSLAAKPSTFSHGTWYIITDVYSSPDITWSVDAQHGPVVDIKASAKVATAELNGTIGYAGTNKAHYAGTPMVYAVIMRRIGTDKDGIRFYSTTHGPKAVFG